MSKVIRDPVILFPPNSQRAEGLPVLKIGDRVQVKGREWLGDGAIVSFNEDGRLVNLSFESKAGWWARKDVTLIEGRKTRD